MNQKFVFIFFFLVLCLVGKTVQAKEIQGVAHVVQKSKKFQTDMDVAVKLDENGALFLALDDFGGVVFASGGENLPQALSLSLSLKEFLSVLRYELPSGFIEHTGHSEVFWTKLKKKKLNIHFSEFISQSGINYPKKIKISYKKNYFELLWLKVTAE